MTSRNAAILLLGVALLAGCAGDINKPDWWFVKGQGWQSVDAHAGVRLEVARLHGTWDTAGLMAVSADGRRVLATLGGNKIMVYDSATGKKIRTLNDDGRNVKAIAISADGRIAAAILETQTAQAWDLETGSTVRLWTGMPNVTAMGFSPDGSKVYFSSYAMSDTVVAIPPGLLTWDLKTGQTGADTNHDMSQMPGILWGHSNSAPQPSLDLSPNGRWRLRKTGQRYEDISQWEISDAADGAVALRLVVDGDGQPSWLKDSSGFEMRRLDAWEIMRVHLPVDLPIREKAVAPIAAQQWKAGESSHWIGDHPLLRVSDDAKTALIGSEYLWREGHATPLQLDARDMQLSTDGTRLAVVSHDGRQVMVYRTQDISAPEKTWSMPESPAYADYQRQAHTWGTGPSQLTSQVQAISAGPQVYALTAERLWMEVPHVEVWNATAGTRLWQTDEPIRAAIFAESGKTLVVFSQHGADTPLEMTLRQTQTGNILAKTQLPADTQVGSFFVSGDGQVAALCSPGQWRFVDVQTGALRGVFPTDTMYPEQLVLNKDGTLATLVSSFGDVYLLETRAGKCLGHFARGYPIAAAAFAGDGTIQTVGEGLNRTAELCQWSLPVGLRQVALPVILHGAAAGAAVGDANR